MAGNSSVLMLRMNGGNGSTTFIDEMGKTVTNTNSTVSTTNNCPYGTGSSMYMNGSAKLTIAASTDLDLGSSDFTIECWRLGSIQTLCSRRTINPLSSQGWYFSVNGLHANIGGTWSDTWGFFDPTTIGGWDADIWHHFALTRSGSTWRFFIDGVQRSSFTNSGAITGDSGKTFAVGVSANDTNEQISTGYMSDLHIIKGYAKYTANFSVPTNYVPKYIQYSSQKVVSMLHFDGVHGTSDILDESGRSWTNNNVKLRSTQYKFGNSSAYFNGSSSYLSTSAGQDFNFGTDDFTIETLLYINGNSPATQDGNYYQANIFSVANTTGQGSPANMFELLLITSGLGANTGTGGAQFAMWNSAGTIASATTGSISQGAWHHIAITRSGTNLNIFLNGTKTTTTIASTFSVDASAHVPLIGYRNYTGYNRYFNGYLDGFQVIKGYAKYTQAFTIPSSPIPRMVLGMHMDSTKTGGTTFVEETGKTITNTNVVGVATNKKFGLTSAYFDGSAYLTVPNSTDLNLAGEDWTISSWIYLTEYATYTNGYDATIISKDIAYNRSYSFYVGGSATSFNFIGMWLHNGTVGTTIDFTTTSPIPLKTWHHVEFVRSGNNIYGFLNGNLVGTSTYTSALNASTNAVIIGAWNHAAGYEYRFRGMIDELVVIKGQALHTSSFTPPTKQFEKNCVAGLRFEGSNGSTTFTDISGKTWTASGGAQISTAQSKIGSSSGYFNGTNSYISTPASSDFAMGTGAWTMECLAYPTSYNGGVYLIHIAGGVSDRTNIGIDAAGTVTVYNSRTGYVDKYHSTTNTVSLNAWTHLAATYDGVTLRIFINGVLSYINNVSFGTWTANQSVYVGATGPLFNANYFLGYLDSVRIIKGEALYIEDFTPPTQDFPNNKSLGMHFDESTAATTFNDLTGKTITVGGNAKLTSDINKFGGISANFDGASYLTTPSNTDFAFGTGDFTIDGWFYIAGDSALLSGQKTATLLQNASNGSVNATGGIALYIYGNTSITGTGIGFWIWNESSWDKIQNDSINISKSAWHHFAVTRKNGNTFIIIDGNLVASGSQTRSITSSNALTIGYSPATGYQWYFNGFIDDLRILKGVALYSDIIVDTPTAELTSTPGTSLLLNGNDLTDITGKTITNNGSVTVNTTDKKFGSGSLQFSGSNYLSTASVADFELGTADFTIEGWFKITGNSDANQSSSRAAAIITSMPASSTITGFEFLIQGDSTTTGTGLGFSTYSSGTTTNSFTKTVSLPKNKWFHIAASRKNGILHMFVNGVLIGSGSFSGNITTNALGVNIGASPYANYLHRFVGLIDDFRVVKGYALYDPLNRPVITTPSSAFKDREDFKFAMYNNTTATNNMASAQQNATPIALYKLNDYQSTSTTTDGTYIEDSSGNGNHAKAYGDLGLATINGITGLYFGGNSSYVESYAISNLQDLFNGYTLEFLVQPNSITSGYANLLGLCQSYTNNTVNDSIYVSKPNNTSTLDAIDDIGTQYYNGATSTTLLTADKSYKSLDGWKHVVVVHSPLGLRKVYVNNQLVGSDYIALPNIAVNRDRIMLGRISGSTNAFVGHLANVAVYDKALTTAQINNNYKAFIGEQVVHLATVIDSILLTELYPSGYTLLAEALESVTLEEINEAKQYAWATGDDSLLTAVESVYIFKAVTVILETITDAINASDVSEGISVQFSTGSDTLQFIVSPAETNYGWVVTAIDQLYFNSLVNEKVIFEGLTSDQLLLATQFLITAPAFVEDSIISTDEGKVFLLVIKTIVEHLTISDSVAPSRSVLSTISDNLNITDQLDSNAFLQAIVTSKLIFTTKSKQGGTVYTGYCVNKNIGATSLYENFKFNSYAKSNGKYYGASTDGIYELDMSDTDNGESINAMFTTGLIDCGNSLKKRITDSFLAVRTDGQVFLRVMADGKEFTYKLSRDNDGMFEGSRVKIGKGLEAVNWQFELFNSEGSDFDIDSMKIYPLMLSRHGGGGSR